MGGDIGCHPNGNTGRAINQKVWYLGGKNKRLDKRVVVCRNEIHRILVQVSNNLLVKLGHPGLGITHGRRGITVN